MTHLEKKKILFLITQSKFGGAQKYVLALARYFAQSNDVLIAVGEAQDQDPRFFDEARALGIEPIIIQNLIRDISLVKAWDAAPEIRKLLAKERPDFLHINSSMAGAIGAFAAWLYRFDPLNRTLRVIYTVHGFVFNEPLPALKKRMYLMIEKISASWKGALICVSQYDKDQGVKHKIAPEKRMVVIHNGIAMDATPLERNEARDALGIPRDAFVVGTIASLYPTKGLNVLIEAAAKVHTSRPNVRFSIIGDGPLKISLQSSIDTLQAQDVIKLHGAITDAHRLLKAFDLFVLPSFKEGFPYAILEAGRANLPVIASRIGGIPEAIEHQSTGLLVEPGSVDDLAQTILTLCDDAARRSSYASALNNKVKAEFTLERMLNETEQLYLRFYGNA